MTISEIPAPVRGTFPHPLPRSGNGLVFRFLFSGFLLTVCTGALSAQTVHDTTFSMRDGVLLDGTITLPADTIPPGGYPGVILVHGFGGDKTDMAPLTSVLSASGYATLAYTVRGQGNSGGYSTASGETERLDLHEVLQQFRALPGVKPDRMCVAGESQGGIHAWMAAVHRMPGVAAAIPTYATPHFARDLVPNNCIKQGLVRELTLGSVRYGSDRDRLRDFVIRDVYDSVLSFINARDLERLVDSIRIPVFQALGWKDAFFPVNAGIRTAANLHGRGIPVWSYYGANGHLEPFNINEFLFVVARSLEWMDRWLKGVPLDRSDVPLVFYADDRPGWPHTIATGWPPQNAGVLRLYINALSVAPWIPGSEDSLAFSVRYDSAYTPTDGWNDRYNGSRFQSAFSSDPVRLLSPPLLDTLDVTGIPRVHLVTGSETAQYQAHTQLYDVFRVDTTLVWRLMTRGANGIRANVPGSKNTSEYECDALSHRIPPGHMIGVEITSLDTDGDGNAHIVPYFLESTAMLYSSPSNPSYVDVPVVGSANLAAAGEPAVSKPQGFALHQNYPNPFNPVTTIVYEVSGATRVTLAVYDLLGREVAVPVAEWKYPGSYTIRFDGNGLPSGVYFYRLTAGSFVQTRRMLLLR